MTAAQFRTVQQPLDPTTAVGEIALYDANGKPLDLSGGGQRQSHRARRRHGSHRDTRQWGVDIGIPAGAKGAPGTAGVGVKSISLTKDTDGNITGGTVTKTDNSTTAITVTTA
jgi:hypothetical protein